MSNLFRKDPDAVLDYTIDWASTAENWLNGDTISSSEWTVDSGITKDSDANTDTTTTIWLSGGTAGSRYAATNRIVTAGGRTNDCTIYLDVEEK